jgi:hypothetical protein
MTSLLAVYRDEFRLGKIPEPVQGLLVTVLSRVARLTGRGATRSTTTA